MRGRSRRSPEAIPSECGSLPAERGIVNVSGVWQGMSPSEGL
jgi:hypothetical protein